MDRGRNPDVSVNTVYDWVLLGVTLAATVPFLIANGALIWRRKRRYFQAQGGVFLILGSSIAGLVWIFSCFHTNGHFRKRGIFSRCRFWYFGYQGLAIGLWFIFTIVRLHRMYRLSNGEPRWNRGYYCLMLLCMLPTVIVSVAAAASKSFEQSAICMLKKSWRLLGWLAASVPYLVVNVVLLWMLRKQTDPLIVTEYKHYSEHVAMAFITVLLAGVAIVTDGSRSVSGRCFLTFCIACLVFTHFWVRFGYPVYLCLFKPKAAMDKFEEELSLSGARALQARNSGFSHAPYPPSSEGAVLEAFYKATTELDIYMNIVLKLRKEKEMLQREVHERQLRRDGIELIERV